LIAVTLFGLLVWLGFFSVFSYSRWFCSSMQEVVLTMRAIIIYCNHALCIAHNASLQDTFFWQDEAEERQWCITCCVCDELNFSEFPEEFNCQSSYW
jgi:hypothetical protein